MLIQEPLSSIFLFVLITLVVCLVVTTYFLVKTLKAITDLIHDLQQATSNINQTMKIKALAAIPALFLTMISKFMRRGR